LSKASQIDTAIYYYRRYLALRPDDANANFSLSGLYYNLSQKDTIKGLPPAPVVVQLTDSAALKAWSFRRDSMQAVLRAAHSESAFVYVDKSIRLGFSREDVYDFYVKIAQASKKRAASVTALQKALQNNPRDAQKWALLGAVYADSGVMAADTVITKISIESYKQACALDSTMRRRCYAWIASQYYKQITVIDPKAVSAYMNRAFAYGNGKGDWPSALADMQSAISADTLNTAPRIWLMQYNYGQKKYDTAYEMTRTILKIDPENKPAREVKKAIEDLREAIKKAKEEE
jgi:tetratricopeptide (TPR) repeat protein